VPPQRPKTAPDVRTPPTPPHVVEHAVPPLATQSPTTATPATPAPAIPKRKPSLRDRFRFRSTSAPAREPAARPRSAYVPTHAASDFSRMMTAPRFRTSADGHDTLSTIDDDDAVPEKDDAMNRAGGPALNAALDCPSVDTESISSAEDDAAPTALVGNMPRPPEPATDGEPEPCWPSPPTQQPSADFADFLARAEREDRAHRVQVWRSLSSAARGPPPAPASRRAAPALGEIPEGGAGRPANKQQPSTLGGTTAVDLGGSTGTARQLGHRKRATWDSTDSAAYVLRRGGDGDDRVPALLDVLPAAGSDGHAQQQQQPRGLKRQASLAKKVGEYIRPTREASGYEAAERRPVRKTVAARA